MFIIYKNKHIELNHESNLKDRNDGNCVIRSHS